MLNIIRVILFLIVNIAGWYAIPVMALVAMKYGFFPSLPPDYVSYFKLWYFGVGVWVWVSSAVLSVGYFFARDEIKNWLLLAPMYVVALYCGGVLFYFDKIYTIQ